MFARIFLCVGLAKGRAGAFRERSRAILGRSLGPWFRSRLAAAPPLSAKRAPVVSSYPLLPSIPADSAEGGQELWRFMRCWERVPGSSGTVEREAKAAQPRLA